MVPWVAVYVLAGLGGRGVSYRTYAIMRPNYSQNEPLLDGVIHELGIFGSLSGVVVLLVVVTPTRDALPILAAVVHGAGHAVAFRRL